MPDAGGSTMPAGVLDLDLLAPGRALGEVTDDATRVLFRIGRTPVGSGDIPPLDHQPREEMLARRITTAHAHRALRLAVARWLRQPNGDRVFSIDGALDAIRTSADAPHDRLVARPGGALTVAICTRDRPRPLARAIRAIVPLLGAADELLVVRNRAEGAEAGPVHEDRRVRYVDEARLGLAWARNRAVAEFRTEVVLFTDDDCVPDAHWLESYRALFARNPDVDLATGLIEPLTLATPAQRLFERYGGFARNYDRRWILAPPLASVAHAVGNLGTYGAGANFAVRRRLLERVGPFDAALGPGTATGAGDDLEMFFRALKTGGLLACEPAAVVRHEHRSSYPELVHQIEGWSRGFSCAIERSSIAFPEEKTAFDVLRARIALLYHARRALLAPGMRRLALAELRGLAGARRRYTVARRDAAERARRVVSEAGDASPHERRPGATTPGALRRVGQVRLDIDGPLAPLYIGADVDEVSVSVVWDGTRVGTVTLPVVAGAVGLDRLGDRIIDRYGGMLIGQEWETAVHAVRHALADRLRASG